MPDDGVVFIYHQSVPDRWPLFNYMDAAKRHSFRTPNPASAVWPHNPSRNLVWTPFLPCQHCPTCSMIPAPPQCAKKPATPLPVSTKQKREGFIELSATQPSLVFLSRRVECSRINFPFVIDSLQPHPLFPGDFSFGGHGQEDFVIGYEILSDDTEAGNINGRIDE